MKYMRIIIPIVICLVCITIFCFVAITGKIYTLDELPLKFISAFLGAMVTAILTLILLSGQSITAEIKERNVKIFNKKSVIFEKFISRLYKVLHEQKISVNTYREIKLEFDTKLVLYINNKSLSKIYCHFEKLAECVGIGMNDGNAPKAFNSSAALDALNKNYYKLRESIYSIINILINDIGLGGKICIKMQNKLEKITFLNLLSQKLLEEVDNLFIKKHNALFKKAFYAECNDGLFLIIPIKGRITPGGEIQIGPFINNSQGESLPNRLVFRLFGPQYNPLVEAYASSRVSNVEGEYINFSGSLENEFDEHDQIDLTDFENSNLYELEKMGVEREGIYNDNISQFGFDDNAYNKFCCFYISICKAIAARAYFTFFTARTAKDCIPIKELCEKFGEVTNEEITGHISHKQDTDLDE